MGSTVVVAGGTTGLGRAIALDRLRRGHRVVVIGRDAERGTALLTEAGADADRAHFIAADLSLISETRRAISEIRALTSRVDALVLCARHFQSTRIVTGEGFEYTFALFYLSRFVLSHEMIDLLVAAPRPVIVNVAGPGSGTDDINWADLEGEHDYSGGRALVQGGQLNDLLAVDFTRRRTAPTVIYVLAHPGTVDTALSGDYDEHDAAHVQTMRARAQPIEHAVIPLLSILEAPPAVPLHAIRDNAPVDITPADPELAGRLFALTTTMLARFTSAAPGVNTERLHRLLDSPVFATVATLSRTGSPHQSVVWIDRDSGDVVFSVALGSAKERNMRRDSRVSILVSPPAEPYTYAAIHGRAVLAPDPNDELLDRLARKYTGHDYAHHHADAAARRVPMVIARVTPDRIIGRL